MKQLLIALLSLSALTAHSQVRQSDCEREADAGLNHMWSIAAAAGSVTQKKIMDQALACMQGRQCSKPEALVTLQEIMVDEEVIKLQRQKVALMKRFAAQAGPTASACHVAQLLPALTEEMTTLNAQQLARFEALSQQRFPSPRK